MNETVYGLATQIIIGIQCLMISCSSVFVLQKVLNHSSIELRLAFIIFPIGASLEFLDAVKFAESNISVVILNIAILLMIRWLWTQKHMIQELNVLMVDSDNDKEHAFFIELRAIISCFALWTIKKINKEYEIRCAVCEKILP